MIGTATLVVAIIASRIWLRALPRTVCPACRAPTVPVRHPLSAPAARWLVRRWCAGCRWEGWGRNGPLHWERQGPLSHRSGRWGPDRLEADFGFRWGHGAVLEPADAAAHPSGFRWRRATADEVEAAAAHPSGFRWGDRPAGAGHGAAAFRWKV